MPREPAVVRQAAVVGAAVGLYAISFGVLAGAAGISPVVACAMSALVFAGGSQFAAIGVLTAGGSPVAAVAAGLLLNTRYVPFGLAIAGSLRRRLPARMLAAHLVTDESAAVALSRTDPAERERAFWWTGSAVFVFWNLGTAFGVAIGQVIGDPRTLGLDAAFPAGFLALLGPLLHSRMARIAAVLGAVIAVALTPLAPPGVPVFVAALAALIGVRRATAVEHDAVVPT